MYGVIIGLCSMVGRFGGGIISDRITRKVMISIAFVICAVDIAIYSLMPQGSVATFVIATVLLALFYGAWAPLVPAFLTDTFGRTAAAALFGLITLAAGIAGGIGAELPPLFAETTGTWTTGLWVGAVCYLIAILFLWQVKPPQAKEG